MKIELLEVAGFYSAFEAIHLPANKPSKISQFVQYSDVYHDTKAGEYKVSSHCRVNIPDSDVDLAKRLIASGDAHAKVMRGIIVWLKITAPIYWWYDAETHRAGHERLSSNSTMNGECKGLTGEELQHVKGAIPFGHEHTKVDYFSYQTLKNMWRLRKNHRLPEFKQFFEFIRNNCPLADELIFVD